MTEQSTCCNAPATPTPCRYDKGWFYMVCVACGKPCDTTGCYDLADRWLEAEQWTKYSE